MSASDQISVNKHTEAKWFSRSVGKSSWPRGVTNQSPLGHGQYPRFVRVQEFAKADS
jgi:hypothetical protein